MKPIFAKTAPLGVRLFFAIAISISLILSDGRSNAMIQVRSVLESAVSALYYFSNTPRTLLDGVSHNFIDSQKLLLENRALKQQLLEKNTELQLLDQLKVENNRLRLLLSSPLRQDEYKKVVDVLTAEMDAYRQQVVINQGHKDGAFVGQPVIDEKGVVGQVISVGDNTSRVLLLTDVTHGIPVQVLRNDVRTVANGTGHSSELILENMPRGVDIKQGDVLVTSGLGGRFPEGYPVAIIESVQNDGSSHFSRATARPLASLERLRHLLLLWPMGEEAYKTRLSPQGVRDVVEERRNGLNTVDKLKPKKTPINVEQKDEKAEKTDEYELPEPSSIEPTHENDNSTEQGAE